ncbi:hypothetical protein HDU84_008358 [Entophlyctis sp. JEL0112]|nr:hypothetical protein HDU84_008358 [Entophlyctis sp. JEL0112]
MLKRKVAAILDAALDVDSDDAVDENSAIGTDNGSATAASEHLVRITDLSLMRRLQTFMMSWRWFNKDDAFSAVECALRGWTNPRPNELRCAACNAELQHSGATLPTVLDTAHEVRCPFRTRRIPLGPAYAFPASTRRATLKALRVRAERLVKLPSHIPQPSQEPSRVVAVALEAAQRILKLPAPPDVASACVILAICGWEPETMQTGLANSPVVHLVVCHLCTRKVDTSGYARIGAASQNGPDSPAWFDPINEHRWYCPWIYSKPEAESGTKKVVGWQIVCSTIEEELTKDVGDNEGGKRSRFTELPIDKDIDYKAKEHDFSDSFAVVDSSCSGIVQ